MEIFISMIGTRNKRYFDDRDRTRTCNPQIRSLMPYPLGHTASFTFNQTKL